MSVKGKKRILVLRYRFIGDTVLTVPFLRNLRNAEPDAHIAWVVAPGSSDVVRGITYVDELIYWDPVTIHADSRGMHRTFSAKLAFLRALRAAKYTKVYVLKRSFSSAIMAWLSGAPERIGFDTEGRGLLLTKRVPYRNDRHEVENFLAVLQADGIALGDDALQFWTTPAEDQAAAELLAGCGVQPGERLVAFHPFASVPERGWHLDDFAALAGLFREQNFRVLVLGAPGDRDAFAAARGLAAASVDLVGKCPIRITMALLRCCTLFVGNDSGVMHLAAASGVPLVAVFGPQSPVKFGPWGDRVAVVYKKFPCSPCRQKFFSECQPSPRMKPECIEAVSVREVFEAGMQLLDNSKEGDHGNE